MAEFQQTGEDLENNLAKCKRLLEEAQGRLKELEEGRKGEEEDEEGGAELKKVQAEVKKLLEDEKSFQKTIKEHKKEEKKLPWNVDSISKEGFSKVGRGIKVTKFARCSFICQHLCGSLSCLLEFTQHQACCKGGNREGKVGEA